MFPYLSYFDKFFDKEWERSQHALLGTSSPDTPMIAADSPAPAVPVDALSVVLESFVARVEANRMAVLYSFEEGFLRKGASPVADHPVSRLNKVTTSPCGPERCASPLADAEESGKRLEGQSHCGPSWPTGSARRVTSEAADVISLSKARAVDTGRLVFTRVKTQQRLWTTTGAGWISLRHLHRQRMQAPAPHRPRLMTRPRHSHLKGSVQFRKLSSSWSKAVCCICKNSLVKDAGYLCVS
ncbi:hypothetical protein AB205_0181140 [Aquarana catesbeiana]|uniref:Uncharacterized protein n=1 Tax=Aquarana catesbeiana TaxID=8400 RepID=A0A2G9S4Z0_AQUCT|nr:hypothetical protein AB205_0181140 [Aquarana catesbeiana]